MTASAAIGYLDGPSDTQLDIVVLTGSLTTHRHRFALRVHAPTGGSGAGFPSSVRSEQQQQGAVAGARRHEQRRLPRHRRRQHQRPHVRLRPQRRHRSRRGTQRPLQRARPSAPRRAARWSPTSTATACNDIVMGDEDGQPERAQRHRRPILPGLPDPARRRGAGGRRAVRLRRRRHDRDRASPGWDKNLYVWDYDFPFSPGRAAAVAAVPPRRACAPGSRRDPAFVGRRRAGGAGRRARARARGAAPNPTRRGTRGSQYAVPADRAGSTLELRGLRPRRPPVRTLAARHGARPAATRRTGTCATPRGDAGRRRRLLRPAHASAAEAHVAEARRDRTSVARAGLADAVAGARPCVGPRPLVHRRTSAHERPRPFRARARPASSTSAARAPRSTTTCSRARTAARSCCASRTPTPRAPPRSRSARSSTGMRWLGLAWDEGPERRRRARSVLPVASAATATARTRERWSRPAARTRATARRTSSRQRRAGAGRARRGAALRRPLPRRSTRPGARAMRGRGPARRRCASRCPDAGEIAWDDIVRGRVAFQQRRARRLRAAALGRPADLQLRLRRRRPRDGDHARDPRRRPHLEHAAPAPALRGVRLGRRRSSRTCR